MFLVHNTDISGLKSILKDGYIKSYSLLKKSKKPFTSGHGDGLYTENKFVYFSYVDKLFDKRIYSEITLYFDSKLLFNKSFYVANLHTSTPNKLYEWWNKDEKGNKIKMYKRKYNKYYTKYNTVLQKLYEYSISLLPHGRAFESFQQIAIRNKINLDNLVGIKFKKNIVSDNVINYIKKYYPNVIIKII
jgi:hypothetical protein